MIIIYRKMKTLGSGDVGQKQVSDKVKNPLFLAFLKDARLLYNVFGKEKARLMLKDTIYSLNPFS